VSKAKQERNVSKAKQERNVSKAKQERNVIKAKQEKNVSKEKQERNVSKNKKKTSARRTIDWIHVGACHLASERAIEQHFLRFLCAVPQLQADSLHHGEFRGKSV
jgi:hypothetical protein